MTDSHRSLLTIFFLLGFFLLFSSQSVAKTVIVTQTDDVTVGQPALFGTLRDAIRNRADPGDTIVFKVKGPVKLLDVLTVPSRLAGLTIQGRVTLKPGRGIRSQDVIIKADNVTVSQVKFNNVSVHVNGVLAGESSRINGSLLQGNTFRGDAQINLTEVENCIIQDNNLKVSPSGNTGRTALVTNETRDCLITGNTIKIHSGTAVNDIDSDNVKFIGNPEIEGNFFASPISGEISDNGIKGLLFITPPDAAPVSGLLVVAHNQAKRISIERTNVQVIKNTVKAKNTGSKRRALSALFFTNADPR